MNNHKTTINTPHIPPGSTLEEGLEILKSVSPNIEKHEDEREIFYKASCNEYEIGIYEFKGKVIAAWYNDPEGRETEEGINEKVTLYLARYGKTDDWEDGINNGWIQFFTNNKNNVGMAYGIQKDVIRFNFFD